MGRAGEDASAQGANGARSSYLSIDALQELQLLSQETHSHLQLLLGQIETIHILERYQEFGERGQGTTVANLRFSLD